MIDFIVGNIGAIKKGLITNFNKLPADPYEKSKGYHFRFRKYSKVIIDNKNKKIQFLKNSFFFQDKKRNRYAGGKKRIFREIDKNVLIQFIDLYKKQFNKLFLYKKKLEIGFHQIRIKCSKEFVGYPVPEGWHKDGFNYVALINFQSSNIGGGVSRIKNSLNKKDTYSSFLEKGDYILINDTKYYHYTDPINILGKTKYGYRDTLVITIKFL
tara:strand:+ start:716 stop:1351 length:636 start_codon:yes stop_codon:yes gene_type:complete